MDRTLVRVLLVEDNPADALLLKESLGSDLLTDFQVTVAERLRQGLEELGARPYDVVLLDLGLPDSQGLETFEAAHAEFPDTPMIVLSGMSDELLALQAVQSGAQDYLVKGEASWNFGARSIRYAIERHQSQLAMRASEARFSTVFHASPTSIAITRISDNCLLEVNEAWTQITGYSPEQAVGQSVDKLNTWVDPAQRRVMLELLRRDGLVRGFELKLRRKSGELADLLMSAELIELSGEPCMLSMALDITERKQAEEKLRESEARFRSIYETTGLGIFESTVDGHVINVNLAYARMFGFETPEAVRQGISDVAGSIYVHSEKRAQFVQYALEHAGMANFENEYRRRDGSTFTGGLKLQAMRDREGRPAHLFGYVEDITERKQAEEKIARAEKRYKSLIERAPDGVALIGADLGFAYVSPSARKIFGYGIDEPLDIKPNDNTHVDDLPMVVEELNRLIQDPSLVPTLQYRFRHKDGSWLWLESTFTNLLTEPSVEAIVINFRDVTERVEAERKIQESEERSRLAHDAAELGTWQEDLLTHIFTLDERARRHYDQDSEHPSAAEVASRIHPEDAPYLLEAITSLNIEQDGRVGIEYRVIHRDGSIHWVGVYSRVHYENRNGERVPVLVVGTSQDITERKRAEDELARRTRQLRLIHEATHRLNVSLDAADIHEVIYANVRQLMPCDTLFVSAFDPASQMISLSCGWHDGSFVDVSRYDPILLEPEGSGIQSQVIRTQEPELIQDFQARLKNVQVVHHFDGDGQAVDEIPEEEDIPRSALVVPLSTEGKVLGVIQVFSYRLNAYTEDDLQILTGFSAQAAIALSNARLYEYVRQENLERKRAEASLLVRTRQLASLFAIADRLGNTQSEEQALSVVASEMKSLMEAPANGVALLEPDLRHFKIVRATDVLVVNLGRRFPIEEGLSGKVLRDGEACFTTNYAADPLRVEDLAEVESLGPGLFIPIRTESQFVGVLFSLRRQDADVQPFNQEDARLLTAVAEIMGSTLQRVRLFEQTNSQLNQLQTLHKMDRAITGSLDLGLTLRLLLTEITSQPEVDAAAVLLVNPHSLILEYAASSGFRTRAIEQMRLLIGHGYAGLAALHRETLQVKDPQTCDEPLRRQIFTEDGFKAYTATPLIAKGKIAGVLELYSRSVLDYGPDWDNFIETLANQASIAIENARLFTDLQRSNLEMELAFDSIIEGWARTVELHACEAEGHSARVVEIALDLAQSLGMQNDEMIQLRRGALLHDIGKLSIPDEILLKPGPLTPEDWEIVRQHPLTAFEILQPIEYLRKAQAVPYCHHEKWDGTGYPRGLAGEQIPLAARIFAIADVYESLTSARPYRPAWTSGDALAFIEEQSGRHFDPRVVEAFRIWFRMR